MIIYNALEAPIFSLDDDFQGAVLPAECAYGIIEVKSSLGVTEFRDAADKIADFKRLCNNVTFPRLQNRFGAVFAYRMAADSAEKQEDCIRECVEIANSFSESEKIDELFVLGVEARDLSQSRLITRVPHEGPQGPLRLHVLPKGRRNIKIFLLQLDSRLRKIRTGQPVEMMNYLFDKEAELPPSSGPDPRRLRAYGEAPISEIARSTIGPKIANGQCHRCGCKTIGLYDDLYCLVATKDYGFGKLGGPQIPVIVLECTECHSLTLVSSNAHDITVGD